MKIIYFIIGIFILLCIVNIEGYTNIHKCCSEFTADNSNNNSGKPGSGSRGTPWSPYQFETINQESKVHHVSNVILGDSFTELHAQLDAMSLVDLENRARSNNSIHERDIEGADIESMKHLILYWESPPRIKCGHHFGVAPGGGPRKATTENHILSQKHHINHHEGRASTVELNHIKECHDELHRGNVPRLSLFNGRAAGGGLSCKLLDPGSNINQTRLGLDEEGYCDWSSQKDPNCHPAGWQNTSEGWNQGCSKCNPGYEPVGGHCNECLFGPTSFWPCDGT